MRTRPATRADLGAVVELFCTYDLAFRGAVDTNDSDVTDDGDKAGFDDAKSTLVVEDDDRVVGFATVIEEYADAMTDPGHTGLLDAVLLPWLEEHAGQLEHYVPDPDTARASLLAARGGLPARRFGCDGSWTVQHPRRSGRAA